MAGHPRLYRRNATYYHRAAIPKDIAATYPKSEETFSLRTKDYQEAVKLVRIAAARVDALFDEFTLLAGDRNFADDHAVIGGLARFNDRPVVVIGHEKGKDTKSRIARNFGMARPEGYRKAVRLMEMADKFGIPVITLIDTPGAYPG